LQFVHRRDGVCQEAWVRCEETLQFIRRRDGVRQKALACFEQTMQVGERGVCTKPFVRSDSAVCLVGEMAYAIRRGVAPIRQCSLLVGEMVFAQSLQHMSTPCMRHVAQSSYYSIW
jgi:hypothetical protein